MITREFVIQKNTFTVNRKFPKLTVEKFVMERPWRRWRAFGREFQNMMKFVEDTNLEHTGMERRTLHRHTDEWFNAAIANMAQQVDKIDPLTFKLYRESFEERRRKGEVRVTVTSFVRFANDRDAIVFAMAYPFLRSVDEDD